MPHVEWVTAEKPLKEAKICTSVSRWWWATDNLERERRAPDRIILYVSWWCLSGRTRNVLIKPSWISCKSHEALKSNVAGHGCKEISFFFFFLNFFLKGHQQMFTLAMRKSFWITLQHSRISSVTFWQIVSAPGQLNDELNFTCSFVRKECRPTACQREQNRLGVSQTPHGVHSVLLPRCELREGSG